MHVHTPRTSSMWTAKVYVHLSTHTHTEMYEPSFTFLDELRNFSDLTSVLIMSSSSCAIWTCKVALSFYF